jgi:hypothetical protein
METEMTDAIVSEHVEKLEQFDAALNGVVAALKELLLFLDKQENSNVIYLDTYKIDKAFVEKLDLFLGLFEDSLQQIVSKFTPIN